MTYPINRMIEGATFNDIDSRTTAVLADKGLACTPKLMLLLCPQIWRKKRVSGHLPCCLVQFWIGRNQPE